MPNFGLKCFFGSFILSLLAVLAVTRSYYTSTEKPVQPKPSDFAKVRSIELYAQNEESDKIYEKFKSLSSPAQVQMPITDEQNDGVLQNTDDEYDDISDTLAFDGEQTGDIIYEPEEDDAPSGLAPKLSDENKKELAGVDIEDDDSDEIVIADAGDAPKFIIPLKHNFGMTSISGTALSSDSSDNPTALASQNINAQVEINANEDFNQSPWETAEVANRYITKNKMNEFTSEHKADVAALDKNKNSEAKAENETKVAYKMVKNILIPIPDEIMNDENLTPQLSYSNKNKKIDADLKRKQSTENQSGDEQANKEVEKIDEAQSKSLTDSITNWFVEGKKQKKTNVVTKDVKEKAVQSSSQYNKVETTEEEPEESEGLFSRLLGLNKKGGKAIIPSELKLAFQPNRAEISGQTLEWLHAFSQNAVKDDDVMIEIRIDGSGSYELQQKRLNLLYTIFANNGVNYDKINIIFTARDPNSFIIRNVKYAAENASDKAENRKVGPWY